jgi:hypothetical protein
MKQNIKRMGLMLGIATLAYGCGGAGDTGRLPSIYQGSWTGTWSSGDANDNGSISFTVTSDGSFDGTIAKKSGSGTVSGTIDKRGTLSGVAAFSTGGNWLMGGGVTTNSNRLISSFSYTTNGVQYSGNFDVAPGGGSTGGG